jgi:hypothetical protein
MFARLRAAEAQNLYGLSIKEAASSPRFLICAPQHFSYIGH